MAEPKIRVLLVDEDPLVGSDLMRAFAEAGLECLLSQVADAEELSGALDNSPDLVIAAGHLERPTVEQVLVAAKARVPLVPFVVLSGAVGEERAVELIRRGAQDFVVQGDPAKTVRAAVRALNESRAHRSRVRAEAHVVRLGRLYRLLSETNQSIVRTPEPDLLLDEVCRLAVRLGPFTVVRVCTQGPQGLQVVVCVGDKGPTLVGETSVLADGRPWLDATRSSGVFPLKVDGRLWGCLGFYSPILGSFSAEEATLLQDLAADLGRGLESRNRDVQRRETEQMLTDMANLVPGVFYKVVHDSDFRIEYMSPGVDLLLPLSPALALGDPSLVFGALHPGDRRKFVLAGRRSKDNLTVFSLNFRLVRPNGAVVWVLATAFPQRRADGSVAWTGVAIDVSSQQRLQSALQREQDLLSVILNNIGDGVVATDGTGRLTLVNRTALALLDRTEGAEPLGSWQNLDPDLPWDSRERFTPWFRRRPDGTELHLEAHVSDLVDGTHGPRGRVMVLRDMTERDRVFDRLRQSEKLESIGLLAGGIAHDFNNLLTGVFGFIQLARMNADDPEKVQSYLDHAQGPFHRARILTEQLLTFAKGGEPSKVRLALEPLVESTARFTLDGTSIHWQIDSTGTEWSIVANEAEVHQVFENLFLNAKQVLGNQGRVSVRLANVPAPGPVGRGLAAGEYVEVVVDDDGPGIPPEDLPRVFDPFFTTKASGTGLGLSICFSVLKKHGGAIEVGSPEGRGAQFRMFWPVGPRVTPGTEDGE